MGTRRERDRQIQRNWGTHVMAVFGILAAVSLFFANVNEIATALESLARAAGIIN